MNILNCTAVWTQHIQKATEWEEGGGKWQRWWKEEECGLSTDGDVSERKKDHTESREGGKDKQAPYKYRRREGMTVWKGKNRKWGILRSKFWRGGGEQVGEVGGRETDEGGDSWASCLDKIEVLDCVCMCLSMCVWYVRDKWLLSLWQC